MTRLVDELDRDEPQQAYAARLLEAGAPLQESEVSRERVLRALRQKEVGGRHSRLRPALAAALLFGLAGTAGAAWGVAQLVLSPKGPEQKVAPADQEPNEIIAPPKRPSGLPPSGVQNSTPEVSGDVPAEQPDAQRKDADGAPATRASTASTKSRGGPAPKKALADPSELVLLHRATEALRSGEDPEKAAELLRRYESTRSSGALDEEALALRIEAALANQDPEAARLARIYFKNYPEGRFRTLAQRALSEKR